MSGSTIVQDTLARRLRVPPFARLAQARPRPPHRPFHSSPSSTSSSPSTSASTFKEASLPDRATHAYVDNSYRSVLRQNPSGITIHSPPAVPTPQIATPEQVALLHTIFARPSEAALSALSARLRFSPEPSPSEVNDPTSPPSSSTAIQLPLPLLEQCLISPSFWSAVSLSAPLLASARSQKRTPHTHHHDDTRATNRPLAVLGSSLLGMLGAEELARRHPHLPHRMLTIALTQYVGGATGAQIARGWGVAPALGAGVLEEGETVLQAVERAGRGRGIGGGLLRWWKGSTTTAAGVRQELKGEKQMRRFEGEMGSVAKAVLGAVYQQFGLGAARQFARMHWFSRQADLASQIRYNDPALALKETLQKYGRKPPEARLLLETGRATPTSLFVVGVFTDTIKLGAGVGSSLAMAKYRANEDAMRRIYLAPGRKDVDLPSDAILGLEGDSYRAGELGDTEVAYESARVGDGPRVPTSGLEGEELGIAEEAIWGKRGNERER